MPKQHPESSSPINTICPIVEFINDQNKLNGFVRDDDDDANDNANDDNDNSSTVAPTSSFDDDGDDEDSIDITMPLSTLDHIFVDYYNESSLGRSISQSISNSKNNIDAVASSTIPTSNTNNNDRTRSRRKPLFERIVFPILQNLKHLKDGRKEEDITFRPSISK